MAKRLGTVGFHCEAQHGGVPPRDADAVVLLCLTKHPHQLIGDNSIQHRNDHHRCHKGEEGVNLLRRGYKKPNFG